MQPLVIQFVLCFAVLFLVYAMVHVQQCTNKRNVKYHPYSPWGHFPKRIFGTKPCTIDGDSSTSDSDSDPDSHAVTDSDSSSQTQG